MLECCATLKLYGKLSCFIAIVAAGDRFTRFNTGDFSLLVNLLYNPPWLFVWGGGLTDEHCLSFK